MNEVRETMAVVGSTEAETTVISLLVQPFPKLIGRKSPHLLEDPARLSWKGLRSSKTQLVIEEACTDSKSNV
jgi:hypothetical protein